MSNYFPNQADDDFVDKILSKEEEDSTEQAASYYSGSPSYNNYYMNTPSTVSDNQFYLSTKQQTNSLNNSSFDPHFYYIYLSYLI